MQFLKDLVAAVETTSIVPEFSPVQPVAENGNEKVIGVLPEELKKFWCYVCQFGRDNQPKYDRASEAASWSGARVVTREFQRCQVLKMRYTTMGYLFWQAVREVFPQIGTSSTGLRNGWQVVILLEQNRDEDLFAQGLVEGSLASALGQLPPV